MLLYFIAGPELPKPLKGHSSLSLGQDLIVLGGEYDLHPPLGDVRYSYSIFKLSCSDGQFHWEELDEKLQTARYSFVADFIPN